MKLMSRNYPKKVFFLILSFLCVINRIISQELAENLNILINPSTLTTSGLSSGGYMAGQFHIAHSSDIKSAAIFSAGPYYCSRGDVLRAQRDCTTNPEFLDMDYMTNLSKEFSNSGLIDKLDNLKNSKVYVFIGKKDARVIPEVSKKLIEFYEFFGAKVKLQEIENSHHAFPTKDEQNNDCDYFGSPFINYCKFDGAFEALSYITNSNKIENENKEKFLFVNSNLIEINQKKYFSDENISMADNAYIYIPKNCMNKSKICDLHIAFHGCKQTTEQIGKYFIERTGYLQAAENLNLIMLFPQARPSNETPFNPNGCWDYWGYNEESVLKIQEGEENQKLYGSKKGKQIATVWKNILDLVNFNNFKDDIY